jgi:hypothetical protein
MPQSLIDLMIGDTKKSVNVLGILTDYFEEEHDRELHPENYMHELEEDKDDEGE